MKKGHKIIIHVPPSLKQSYISTASSLFLKFLEKREGRRGAKIYEIILRSPALM